MPNNLNNWTYQNVVDLLKEHNFRLNHTRGSHFYFVGHTKGRYRQVCVPFHGSKAIKPRTLKGIIIQSGIEKNIWLDKN